MAATPVTARVVGHVVPRAEADLHHLAVQAVAHPLRSGPVAFIPHATLMMRGSTCSA